MSQRTSDRAILVARMWLLLLLDAAERASYQVATADIAHEHEQAERSLIEMTVSEIVSWKWAASHVPWFVAAA